ncbi:hypothetical protein Hbl1158_15405 (plasmid) [Halobaculum sp. CBA1158]|uniref:DUF7563 family protein n=1 Tax=Halobaculum sp. CBA1158 TaxID=2904243 RepID=UPI001F173560|nr:hypothetical protein [Halobaculum sp. CBA1158]UIP01521.1 hypothetical protein Hbl1158_15405 [Halobaculum sp. CBA1158]
MPECVTCGSHVTERFARVFGDNRDVVRRCIACSRAADLDESGDPEEGAARADERVLTTWS